MSPYFSHRRNFALRCARLALGDEPLPVHLRPHLRRIPAGTHGSAAGRGRETGEARDGGRKGERGRFNPHGWVALVDPLRRTRQVLRDFPAERRLDGRLADRDPAQTRADVARSNAVAQVPARMWRSWVLAQMWARTSRGSPRRGTCTKRCSRLCRGRGRQAADVSTRERATPHRTCAGVPSPLGTLGVPRGTLGVPRGTLGVPLGTLGVPRGTLGVS